MTKKDLKLIDAFIDSGNPKPELNYALVTNGCIVAINTRRIIQFNVPGLKCNDSLVHKKLLKGFESLMTKNSEANIVSPTPSGETWIECEGTEMLLSTCSNSDFKFPDFEEIIRCETDDSFDLDSLNMIDFELSSRKCYIDSSHLDILMAYGECSSFSVFYRPQTEESSDIARIDAYKVVDEQPALIYTAVLMGVDFKNGLKD